MSFILREAKIIKAKIIIIIIAKNNNLLIL